MTALSVWGGVIEIILSCENFEECNTDTKNLVEKLKNLEGSKNIQEILKNFRAFTKKEINYLNSPLLDEISFTIRHTKSPLVYAFQKEKKLAIEFYLERGELFTNDLVKMVLEKYYEKTNIKNIIQLLLIYVEKFADETLQDFKHYYNWHFVSVSYSKKEIGCGIPIYDTIYFSLTTPTRFEYFKGGFFGFQNFYYISKKEDVEYLENLLKKLCEKGHHNYEVSINNAEKMGRYNLFTEKKYGNFESKNWFCITLISLTNLIRRGRAVTSAGFEFILDNNVTLQKKDTNTCCSCYSKYLETRKSMLFDHILS